MNPTSRKMECQDSETLQAWDCLGHGTNGFEQAALVYFHKSFRQLTEDEYTALVAMVVAPNVFDLQRHPARNAERVARIRRLVRGRYRVEPSRSPGSSIPS